MFQEHFGGQFEPRRFGGLGAMFGRAGGNRPGFPMTGGALPPMQFNPQGFRPMTGGPMPSYQMGYDSSGINPGGMYGGPQFPRNPGGFMPMGRLAGLFRGYGG